MLATERKKERNVSDRKRERGGGIEIECERNRLKKE